MSKYVKGLFKDSSRIDQVEGSWRYAKNAVMHLTDGAISNEKGMSALTKSDDSSSYIYIASDKFPGYKVIGAIETTDDRVVLFSVNTLQILANGDTNPHFGRSEIGILIDDTYTTVYNPNSSIVTNTNLTTLDNDLKFSTDHPIEGSYKIHASGDLFVYWTDNSNPPRCMNITRQMDSNTQNLYGNSPSDTHNKNFIDRLNLFPHSGPVPHITFKSINSGGGLKTAVYFLALAYVDTDLVQTNFLTIANPISIVEDVESVFPIERYDGAPPDSQTGKSITWTISNLNTDYEYLQPVVVRRMGDAEQAFKLNKVEINSREREIVFTGIEGYEPSSVDDIIIDTVAYDTAKSITQLDNIMYLGNLSGTKDLGYQKFANNIKLKSVTKTFSNFDRYELSTDNLSNGYIDTSPNTSFTKDGGYRDVDNIFRFRGYMRDEVYAFYIAFILNDGSMSYAYHIPGREALSGEKNAPWEQNLLDISSNQGKNFHFKEYSDEDDANRMNYWENANEQYPTTEDYEVWDAEGFTTTDTGVIEGVQQSDLGGTNVRHHHFPSNKSSSDFIQSNHSFVDSTVEGTEFTATWTAIISAESDMNTYAADDEYGITDENGEILDFGQGLQPTDLPYVDSGVIIQITGGTMPTDTSINYTINILSESGLVTNLTWNILGNNSLLERQVTLVGWGDDGWTAFTGWNEYLTSPFSLGINELNDIGEKNKNTLSGTITWTQPVTQTSGEVNDSVKALGFHLEDVKIPATIAEKVQGFRIYYAKPKYEDRRVLGQNSVVPMKLEENITVGTCTEESALGVQNQENFWVKYPFVFDSVTGNKTNYDKYDVLSFHDFNLLRTKNSLAAATHISVDYQVDYFSFTGYGFLHEEEQDIDACKRSQVVNNFHIASKYNKDPLIRANRALKERCKTYLKGDSIYDGRSLGFGYKIYNNLGESCIALGLSSTNEDDTLPVLTIDHEQFAGENGDPPEFGATLHDVGVQEKLYHANLHSFKTDMYNTIDSQELVWTGFEVVGDQLDNFIVNRTYDIPEYIEIDAVNQQTIAAALDMPADFSTETVQITEGMPVFLSTNATGLGIYGGDTFICRYGWRSQLTPNWSTEWAFDMTSGFFNIVESRDNINFRHEEGDVTTYFPGSSVKRLLFCDHKGFNFAGEITSEGDTIEIGDYFDLTHQDNLKYNGNYSALNDIRPAFALPLTEGNPVEFSTRVHRSAKSDPGSLIDNFRVYLALQYKDLPKNRGDIRKLVTFNNLLYMHTDDSLFITKGKQKVQLADQSEAFIGSGDLFAQEPEELLQTEAGYGGTQSQWASLVTKYGYFYVDQRNRRVFMAKDKIYDIGAAGMEKWFQENLKWELENLGMDSTFIDNPINHFGFTSTWDEKNQRIILTKRELIPTSDFMTYYNQGQEIGNTQYDIKWNPIPFYNHNEVLVPIGWIYIADFVSDGAGGTNDDLPIWESLPLDPEAKIRIPETLWEKKGWTISFNPEINVWVSFHDYMPYLYTYKSDVLYSFTDEYSTDFETTVTSTYVRNYYIWKHDDETNPGDFYGNTYNFELEFIHNEAKDDDKVFYSFTYVADVFEYDSTLEAHKLLHQNGFTKFFAYTTHQNSGEANLEYMMNIRRVGNEWKVNKFRDLAVLIDNTNAYYTGGAGGHAGSNYDIVGTNVAGTVTQQVVTHSTEKMFTVDGMSETINTSFIDTNKSPFNQRKFIDKFIGIRLIYNNISNNLVNLYSTRVGARKFYR